MRIWHWLTAALLLFFPMSASAQQTANSTSSTVRAQIPASAAPASPVSPTGKFDALPADVAPRASAASANVMQASRPSATMDSIVDRALERENALIELLKTRTPFVETYLQDLQFRPQEGPVPVQDHYFLGRMDL